MRSGIIYLVGFMGAGKSCVGACLATLLRWPFIDLDREIERGQGRPIREIFRLQGEPAFRELERRALEKASVGKEAVVALGGGAFLEAQNRQTVASTGTSIWLNASMDILYPRCANDPTRPLFASREEMEQLLALRLPSYRLADFEVEVDNLTPFDVARRILDLLLEQGSGAGGRGPGIGC